MTKLISGRVAKIPSANVSADRREFIDLAETEPDLGLPSVAGWVLSSDLTGNRIWVDPVQASGGTPYFANTSLVSQFAYVANVSNITLSLSNFTTANLIEGINLYYTNARVLANVSEMSINVFTDVDITGIVTNGILTWNGSKFIAGTIESGTVANSANFAYVANVANIALTLSNFTTANLIESSSNLYFTVNRVNATVQPFLTTANLIESSSNLYFTVGRVNAAVQPFLTTANVIETSGNLYYTNARVVAALIAGQNIIIESNGRISANIAVVTANSLGLTTADVREVASNLYYTNARARTSFTAGNGIIVDWANGTISANISATTANSLGLTTADVREVASNLYFSNARAIASFGAGNGIEISGSGIISARGLVPLYTIQTAGVFGNVSSTMSNIITFPSSPSTDRFMVRSIHVVNMSGSTALVSGNILYSTGNTVPFANQIPVSQGGILEFFRRSSSYQLFQPGDTINLQGFNAAGTATANLMCVTLSYDTFSNDETYIGTGKVLSNVDSTIQVYDSGQTYSVIESIKFVNLQSAYAPVKAWYADANGIPKSFFVYNLSIPPNSTVEILQSIKRIEQYDKIYASYSNAPNAAVSIFVSARVGSVTGLYDYTPTAVPGGAAEVIFTATDPEGTTFYYTIE